jgi:TPR repeat protein
MNSYGLVLEKWFSNQKNLVEAMKYYKMSADAGNLVGKSIFENIVQRERDFHLRKFSWDLMVSMMLLGMYFDNKEGWLKFGFILYILICVIAVIRKNKN